MLKFMWIFWVQTVPYWNSTSRSCCRDDSGTRWIFLMHVKRCSTLIILTKQKTKIVYLFLAETYLCPLFDHLTKDYFFDSCWRKLRLAPATYHTGVGLFFLIVVEKPWTTIIASIPTCAGNGDPTYILWARIWCIYRILYMIASLSWFDMIYCNRNIILSYGYICVLFQACSLFYLWLFYF